jgi:hypothetical protein
MAAQSPAVDINKSNISSGCYLDISYQNVKGLRTKSVENFNNVCSFNFEIICLMETWLNEFFFSHIYPPQKFTLYIVLTDCHRKL